MTTSNGTTVSVFFDPPPPPPRALTGRLRYRALAAKPVSMLLLTSLIIVVACAYTAVGHFQDWSRIRRLKDIGHSAEAQVTDISRSRPAGQRGAAREYVTFQFRPLEAPQAEPISGQRLHSLFPEQLKLGSRLSITYDPANPQDFFCLESDDCSLVSQLGVQIFFLIIVALLLLLAGFRYYALLHIACRAPAESGRVAEIRTSAQGAFSRLLVVTLQVADRTLILKRVVPVGFAQRFSVGDSVWLLVPPRKPSRAIIAAAFL